MAIHSTGHIAAIGILLTSCPTVKDSLIKFNVVIDCLSYHVLNTAWTIPNANLHGHKWSSQLYVTSVAISVTQLGPDTVEHEIFAT